MKPWSKLQKQVYNLISEDLHFQIHCAAYPMRSMWHGSTDLPRYWITLGKEIIWDYPKDFIKAKDADEDGGEYPYPYCNDASEISQLLREYIDTPKEELITKTFEEDKWGLTAIFKAADRRTGKRQLVELQKAASNKAVLSVIANRLDKSANQKNAPDQKAVR